MAQEITTQNTLNVDAFKTARPAAAFATLDPSSESLAEGIGSSYPVIGYKGKVWSLRYRGEKKIFTRADDGSPISYIDVIILRQAHHKSKSYYEAFDEGQSGGARPICASLDSIVPDDDVIQKQSETCALCPRNVWKTDANGRKTRECTDYKRLAVLLLPGQTKGFFNGVPLMEPAFLRVPPASLNDLAVMGETMSGQNWHYSSFITRISFDPTAAHPKMQFRPLQGLSDAEAPIVLSLREDAQAKRITGEDHIASTAPRLTAPVQTTGLVGVQAPIAQATVQQQAQPPVQQPAVQQQAQPPVQQQPVSTGLLELSANRPAAVTAPVVDNAPAQQSDEALDARIANLLKTG